MEKEKKESAEVKIYETSNIHLAAFLKMKGYKLVNCVPCDSGGKKPRISFGFEEQESRSQDVMDFFNGKGQFLDFVKHWSDIKSLIHSL